MTSTFDLFPWFKTFNINPVTDWQRFINPQFNVTVNQGDAAIENHVLARAGSYGKQIGRMQEVLDVLIARMPPPALSAGETRSLDKYQRTRMEVVAAVDEARPGPRGTMDGADFERWLDGLAEMRQNSPARFERLAGRIRQFLDERPSAPASGDTSARKRR
jgi:hypothetical protein